MKSNKWAIVAAVAGLAMAAQATMAATTTNLTLYPSATPDEQMPRGFADAPSGWGDSSWQGPATGKSNLQLRFGNDGNLLGQLFPTLSSLTIGDLDSISYNTNQNGEPTGHDWWVTIYTAKTGSGDAGSWYHAKYTSNFGGHNNSGWTEYSTANGAGANGITFDGSNLLSALPQGDTIESIAFQTDSGWNGFNGLIDGITIALDNGDVGQVNLQAVPLPSSAWGGLALLGMMGAGVGAKRLRKQPA